MKKLLIILASIFGILLILSFIFSSAKTPGGSFPFFQIPTPTPISVDTFVRNQISSPFEKSIIDKTTQQQVEKMQDVVATPEADGITTYTVPSVNAILPDTIQTQNNTVIYERTSLYTSNPGGFPSLSAYLQKLGTPEQVIQGNIIYGEGINSYLFPHYGVVLIGNSATNETYEIQRFSPMSLLEYLRQYGDTVKQEPDSGGETGVGQ